MDSRSLLEIFENDYAPLRRLSPKTLAVYRVTFRHFDQWLSAIDGRPRGPARPADLSDLAVSRFVAAREAATCIGTAKRDRVQLCAIWRYCARKGIVAQWPELPPMRVPERVPRATKAEELDQLLDYCRWISGTIDGVPASAWWGSLIPALFQCGTRIGETLAVRWQDVDLEGRTILFRAETRKGKTRDILRDITPELAAMLAARKRPSGLVWRWDRVYTHLWSHFQRHCATAGITYRGFHAIRKAACSYTKAAGGDPTKLADHSDAATTEVYLDPTIARGESNLARLPILRGLRGDDPPRATTQRESGAASTESTTEARDAPPPVVERPASTIARPAQPCEASDAQGPQADASALRAGFAAGKAIAAAGMARPDRATASMLAVVAGCKGSAVALYGHGLTMGWDEGRGGADAIGAA
jgi:integrase